MSVNRLLLFLAASMVFTTQAVVAQEKNLGAHFSEDSPFQRPESPVGPEGELEEFRRRMMERDALDKKDRTVLGTFWQETPLKDGEAGEKEIAVTSLGYREYLRIIETRCILCHQRDRIDEAIEKQLPFRTMEEIMRKRQVILTPREREVMKTFWGTPLK